MFSFGIFIFPRGKNIATNEAFCSLGRDFLVVVQHETLKAGSGILKRVVRLMGFTEAVIF